MTILKKFSILIVGVLLGAITSYLAVTKVIALRGSVGMHGFMDAAASATTNANAVDLITCMKLAKHLKYSVNHFQLNLALNNELKPFDNGTDRVFNVLVYVKGYGVGLADAAQDKKQFFNQLNCLVRFPDILDKQAE